MFGKQEERGKVKFKGSNRKGDTISICLELSPVLVSTQAMLKLGYTFIHRPIILMDVSIFMITNLERGP